MQKVEKIKESDADGEISEEALQRLRNCIKISGGQSEVSKRSGVPLGSLNHYLKGREMKLSAAAAIARACNVSVDFLASGLEMDTAVPPLEIFRPEIWNAKAHFWALFIVLRVAREYHDKMGLVPTLGELLTWMSPVYIGHMSAPDGDIEFASKKEMNR
jgi:transcriptional regulator with XRE-family HTH domain